MALTPGTFTVMADIAWRVTLVLAAAWGAARLMGRRPAALRHAVWVTSLLAALAVPMVAGLVPTWRLAVLPAAPVDAIVPSEPNVPSSRPNPRPAPPSNLSHATPAGTPTTAQAVSLLEQALPTAAVPERSAADWLGLLWATVAAIIIGRYCASVASVRWLTRDAEPVRDLRWRDASDVASAELGLPETPALLASDHVTVPFTSGVLRPVVVVPASALTTWSDERIRVVLLHELAHVRRRDCLVQAMTQVACAAYWFNPLTWIASRRLRAERERACDDLVLEAGTRGADYAQHLLDIARTVTPRRSLSAAALAMARPSELEGRLLAILDGHRARRVAGSRFSWRMAAAVAAIVVAVASVQPVAREATVAIDDVASLEQGPPAPTPTPTPTPTPAPAHVAAAARAAAQVAVSPATSSVSLSSTESIQTLTATESAQVSAIASRVVGSVVVHTGEIASSVVNAVSQGAAQGVSVGLRQLALGQEGNTPGFKYNENRQTRTASPAVIQGLTEAMKDSDAEVRKQAMQALARLGAPVAYEALITALKDEDAEVREQAAFSLGQLGDTRAIDSLAGALKDAEPDVRQQAAFALSQMKAVQAVPALRVALKDTDEDVRQQAIFALSQIGDRSAVPAFVEALNDTSEDVREQALFALSQLGDSSAVAAILPLLAKDDSEDVRQQAAFALSQIGDESAVPALTAALKDASPEVRRQAIFALSQIADGDTEHDRKPRHNGLGAPTPTPSPTPTPNPKPVVPPTPKPR
jgi:HEAT repeat protein/beta-lactamase regulating signal transducer with metallopeptidase domain